MNPNLNKLQPYPFEKLKLLIDKHSPNSTLSAISLAIGEPQHNTPDIIKQALTENLQQLAKYPTTRGTEALRNTFLEWLKKRFQLNSLAINAENNFLPVNGTREALFAVAQCVINSSEKPVVLIPNPFYQIYEGAALIAGAEPIYYNSEVINGDIPGLWEIKDEYWQRCQLIYICTPGNPTGEVIPPLTLQKLLGHSLKHNFTIASDECYSEIYSPNSKPPVGLLHVAQSLGNDALENCMAFYSLSKRSNAPGLRSGFVAGSSKLIQQFFQYRTYHGCAMPLAVQAASIAAWSDEKHVAHNRQLYAEKFDAVLEIFKNTSLVCKKPEAGFYLWPTLPPNDDMDDEKFAQTLYVKKNILTLPGSYLARDNASGQNPGKNHLRLALVAKKQECIQAAQRITEFLQEI